MATDNRTLLNGCESAADSWAGDDSVTDNNLAGLFYQGTQGLSTQLSNALERMTCSTIGGTRNLSAATVWFLVKDNLASTKANGGYQIVLSDGTDEVGFYCNGNDDPPLTLDTLFFSIRLDVSNRSALSSNAYSGSAGALTVTAITGVGYGSNHTAKAQGAVDNVFLDAFRFIANTSYALTIDGGTAMTPETFADIAADDLTNGWGMISNLQGSKIDINASWEWGAPVASPNASSYFEDSNFQCYIDARDAGTGNFIIRTRAGTGTNSLVLTDGLFINLGTASVWDFSDTDMNTLTLTRITFTDIGTLTLPTDAAGRSGTGCVFNNCGQVALNGFNLDNTNFNGASNANGAVLLDTSGDSDNASNLDFTSDGTGHAIDITATGSYDFNDWTFNGYGASGTANAVVRNNSGGAVTINVIGGDTPTVLNVGMSTTTINNAVTVRVDGVAEGTAIKVVANETVGTITLGDIILEGLADSTGALQTTTFNYESAFDPSGLDVLVTARNQGLPTAAIADDGGVLTDQTTAANSGTTNDMTLVPATPAVNDAYYWGHPETYNQLKINISTAGSGLTITWEYWNGSSWAALSGVTDGTNSFTTTGLNRVSWTLPSWSTTTVNGQGPYYYVRARVSAVASPTQALGRWSSLDVTRYLPIPPQGVLQRTITSSGLTATLTQAVDNISTF